MQSGTLLWWKDSGAMAILKMPLILGVKVSNYRFRLGASARDSLLWPSARLSRATGSCHQARDRAPALEEGLHGPRGRALGLCRASVSAARVLPPLIFCHLGLHCRYRDQACPQPSTVAGDVLVGFHFTGSPV